MSKIDFGNSNIGNSEDNIYIGTINEILSKASKTLNVPLTRSWANKMEAALLLKFYNYEDKGYFRNLSTIVKKAKTDPNKHGWVSMRGNSIYLLMRAAGFELDAIKNYQAFNARFNPNEPECVFIATPYTRFQMLRSYKTGKLVASRKGWEFAAEDFSIGNENILSIKPYRMQGEQNIQWLKVCYKKDEQLHTAFFSQRADGNFTGQEKGSLLYNFLIGFRTKR